MTSLQIRLLAATIALFNLCALGCSDDDKGDGDAGADGGLLPDGGVDLTGKYFDADGNPVDDVYDINGDPVTDAYAGPLFDKDGNRVFDENGVPATFGETGDGDGSVAGCGATPFESEPVPANLLVVVDASGSMSAPTQADANVTSWQALTTAVDGALGGVSDRLAMGLQLYPQPDGGDSCSSPRDDTAEVDVADGATAHPLIVSAMGARMPDGGTPTSSALFRARNYFTTGAGKDLDGDKIVLLATDGGPNCNANLTCQQATCVTNLESRAGCMPDSGPNCCDPAAYNPVQPDAVLSCLDDDLAVMEVEVLALAGVRTMVLGIPGSEIFRDVLIAMATAGGGADGYFEVKADQDVSELTGVLRGITEGLITSCKFQLEATPPDPNALNVEIDGEFVPKSGDDGWDLDEGTSPPTVVVKGATCEGLRQDGATKVEIVFGCPTVE